MPWRVVRIRIEEESGDYAKKEESRGGDRRGAGGGDKRYRIRSGRTYGGVVGDGGGRRGIELR